MTPRVNERTHTPHTPLSEALGRAVPLTGGLTEHAVVAYWPGLDSYTLDDEQETWTAKQWAEHLEDPLLEHPFSAGPQTTGGPYSTSMCGFTLTTGSCPARSGLRPPTASPAPPASKHQAAITAATGSLFKANPAAST